MPITIRPYTDEYVEAVRQFNARLHASGVMSQFPSSPISRWLPKVPGRTLYQEFYLAVDDRGAVRGGYILKHQEFLIRERVVRLADLQLPISEGTINRSYSLVGVQLLRDAIARQPLLFGLGIGGYREPLARLLAAAGWIAFSVPFFFRVVHPRLFLRELTYMRQWSAARLAINALEVTRLGWLGIQAAQTLRGRRATLDPTIAVERVDEYSAWTDELWKECKGQYGMSAVRNCEHLKILYPKNETRIIRLKVSEGSRPIGWAVVLDTALVNHKYFGNMRLGSIVSCLSAAANGAKIIAAARTFLESRGVDLIVSNHSHAAWCHAFRRAGFLRGPSNFIFAASPQLAKLLEASNVQNGDIHINRGDGDGPINL